MALALDAKNYVARNDMGVVLLDMGRFEEAAAHFRKRADVRPNVVDAFGRSRAGVDPAEALR